MNKIAIHKRVGSFSDRWIEYCLQNTIDFKIVNCYEDDILEQLKDCEGLLWHWQHNDSKAILFAKQLIYLLELSGKKVFPNTRTIWHFDDKICQKYIFESIKAPLPKTILFFDKEKALNWAAATEFPKVFKLRRGAGSNNVLLVKDKNQAKRLIKKAFYEGFPSINKKSILKDKYLGLLSDFKFVKAVHLIYRSIKILKENSGEIEKGYVLFQDYIDTSGYDIRTVIVGSKCVAIKRLCRKHDFRASGSGLFQYDHEEIDPEIIRISFQLYRDMRVQIAAFDFVKAPEGIPYVLEVSYAFAITPYDLCDGYWDDKIIWHQGKLILQNLILEEFLEKL